MELVKEIIGRIKDNPDRLSHVLSQETKKDLLEALNKEVIDINISKTELYHYSNDEIIRMLYLLNYLGANTEMCSAFRIFYSKRNKKFHKICMATQEKIKTLCDGSIENCDKGYYNKDGTKSRNYDRNIPKIKWSKL